LEDSLFFYEDVYSYCDVFSLTQINLNRPTHTHTQGTVFNFPTRWEIKERWHCHGSSFESFVSTQTKNEAYLSFSEERRISKRINILKLILLMLNWILLLIFFSGEMKIKDQFGREIFVIECKRCDSPIQMSVRDLRIGTDVAIVEQKVIHSSLSIAFDSIPFSFLLSSSLLFFLRFDVNCFVFYLVLIGCVQLRFGMPHFNITLWYSFSSLSLPQQKRFALF
jgi:hypothetical protein